MQLEKSYSLNGLFVVAEFLAEYPHEKILYRGRYWSYDDVLLVIIQQYLVLVRSNAANDPTNLPHLSKIGDFILSNKHYLLHRAGQGKLDISLLSQLSDKNLECLV